MHKMGAQVRVLGANEPISTPLVTPHWQEGSEDYNRCAYSMHESCVSLPRKVLTIIDIYMMQQCGGEEG